MKVVIFGASGMVGSGALRECLDDARVDSVLVVGRSSCGVTHPKVQEILHPNFLDFTPIQSQLTECDACFFCLGVTSAGMSESDYTRVTYDITIAAAVAMLPSARRITFCFVSGVGADSTEKGRVMWARVKGKTENALLAMPFKRVYVFRPGIIQPVNGVRSKTALYRAFYAVSGPIFPVLRWLAPRSMTTTATLGRAFIQAADTGYSKKILFADDFNRLARGPEKPLQS